MFREFCRIDPGEGRVPDATTLRHFRHLMEKHELGMAWFARASALLQANGRRFSGGTIVDATLIDAPPSTRKGNRWHLGMKVHIGADSLTAIVHHASVTAAHVHDSHEVPNLLLGNETRLDGDGADRGQARRKRLKTLAARAKDFPHRRACRNRPSSEADNAGNRRKSRGWAKLEHPFLTRERLWGFAKACHRGLARNAHRAFAMPVRHNLVKWGRPLTGAVRPRSRETGGNLPVSGLQGLFFQQEPHC